MDPSKRIAVNTAAQQVSGFVNFVSESFLNAMLPQWMVRSHLEFVYRIFQSPAKQLRRCREIISAYPAIYKKEKRRRDGRI